MDIYSGNHKSRCGTQDRAQTKKVGLEMLSLMEVMLIGLEWGPS